MRDRVSLTMGELSKARPDLFLAFLRLGLKAARDGGYLLFVLPHSFLLARNASELRKHIAETCWVHVLDDLSEIPVFEGIGSYLILIVLKKRPGSSGTAPRAAIVRCREFVGRALSAALQRRFQKTDFYEVFEVDQKSFQRDTWTIVSREELTVHRKLETHPCLREIADVRQGMVTGCDDVFIRDAEDIPASDRKVWLPFLRDREIERYHVPRATKKRVFYPFEGDVPLTEHDLRERFPKTYQQLCATRSRLVARGPVRAERVEWWRPDQPRPPKNMLRPKLVTPHLVLRPRFALDKSGRFAVSRSPLILCRAGADDMLFLKYLLAILNSTVGYWQTAARSHKYRSGYTMLEVKTLRDTRIPVTDQPSAMQDRAGEC